VIQPAFDDLFGRFMVSAVQTVSATATSIKQNTLRGVFFIARIAVTP